MNKAARRIADLDFSSLHASLCAGALDLHAGPFRVRLTSPLPDVARALHTLYGEHHCSPAAGFADFHLALKAGGGLRRWWRPQVRFIDDGHEPFRPLPRNQAFAMFEWGFNWCIAAHAHQYLVIHAAVLARGGDAVLLPAPPGSGKSTLCAALAQRGWRLCSDELALIRPETGAVQALARPVNLKNQSIALIRDFAPQARFGPLMRDTAKGTVAHMAPPTASVAAVAQAATPRWIVFPRWQKDAPPDMATRSRAQAFIDLADNAFNYSVLGETGFDTLRRVVDGAECLSFSYGRLDDAVRCFERLGR